MKIKTLKLLCDKLLTPNEFAILKILEDNSEYMFKNVFWYTANKTRLITLGYITADGNSLSEKGREFIKSVEKPKENTDLITVYKDLEKLMIKLTGKRNKIISGKYSFFMNERDFVDKLGKTMEKYKLNDISKVKKCLENHIANSVKAEFKRVTLLNYYISKDNVSILATDYETINDVEAAEVKEELKKVKDLF